MKEGGGESEWTSSVNIFNKGLYPPPFPLLSPSFFILFFFSSCIFLLRFKIWTPGKGYPGISFNLPRVSAFNANQSLASKPPTSQLEPFNIEYTLYFSYVGATLRGKKRFIKGEAIRLPKRLEARGFLKKYMGRRCQRLTLTKDNRR